jgi:two-component system NtrC family response regulator
MLASVRSKTIDADQFAIQQDSSAAPHPIATRSEPTKSLYDAVEGLERRMIQEALTASGGNKLKAAQALGLSRQGLFKKLKKLGVNT